MLNKKSSMCKTFCAIFLAGSLAAAAQSYPTKPVRLVVPLAPGGGGDFVARLIAQYISESMRQPVLVDNRPGGSTVIGSDHVARSAPDGYTLLMASSSHGINPSFMKLPFDPVRDFTGIAYIGTAPMMLSVHPGVPARTVKQLIALAKARPGELTFASSGTASIVHLAGELFNIMAGVKLIHVPYKGTGPAMIDLLGGRVDMTFGGTVPTIPHVKSGKLRAIGIASKQRSPALPDLPTVAESGLPGFDAETYYIVLGPAGVPQTIVAKLNSEMIKAAQLPDAKERLLAQGAVFVGGSPQQATAHIESEIARWSKVVKATGIKSE